MNKLDKKDFVCLQPFEFAEFFDYKSYMCCPNWLPVDLGDPMKIKENWQSDKADDIRKSVVDGSYRHCIESRCPKLTGLKEGRTDGFMPKKEFLKKIDDFAIDLFPKSVKFNFDQSCNLMCPSCRLQKINYEGAERKRTEQILQTIEDELADGLERIECTGSGDPFFSRTFRKWMMNFDPAKYPNLKSMHLHTNATLWNHSNWSRMTKVHKYIKSAEISIDAATKDTYENYTRLGGKWDDLQENLRYIAKIPTLNTVTLSFVVQSTNYKEMEMFYKMGEDIFDRTTINWQVFYNRVVNWGTFNKEDFKALDVGDPNHPNYQDLLNEYRKLPPSNNIRHNLTV
jgi:MoaA/NifB/PqqE/SkfB family radical SAM enzyme